MQDTYEESGNRKDGLERERSMSTGSVNYLLLTNWYRVLLEGTTGCLLVGTSLTFVFL